MARVRREHQLASDPMIPSPVPAPPSGSAGRVAVSLVALVLLAGCASNHGKITLDRTSKPRAPLTWGSCTDVHIAVSASVLSSAKQDGMECATLKVPVDHADPSGDTIDLAVARIPATGRSNKRIGSLIVNPGGPGGSGLEFLASSAIVLPEALRKQFDIVSFDPRGIAASSPLDCLTETRRADLVDEVAPDDPAAAQAEAAAAEKEIADGCAKANADLFHHMGTDQVAADLDGLRAAVGDDRLTFLGLAYGTRIAAAYATAFPDKVRAIVLDGSVTPSRDLVESGGGQLKGIVRALDAFVQSCNADTTCPLAPDALGTLTSVSTDLETTPLTIKGDHGEEALTKDKFITGVVTALYDPSAAMPLAEAVAALADRSDADRTDRAGTFVLKLAGQQSSQEPDGTYGNGFETQGVVNCLDADGPLDRAELPKVRELAGPIPPFLDTDPATDTPSCTVLPTGDGLRIAANDAKDRLLVVGTKGDPATPIEWTDQMVATLGSPALITYGGSGHTASLTRTCVTDQVTAFFIDGKVPATLADCPREPAESDIYAALGKQLALEVGNETAACIADALRDKIDPLTIVGLDSDSPDAGVISELRSAAVACR